MYLRIEDTTTLSQLSARVSADNVSAILAANGLAWRPDIGKQLVDRCNAVLSDTLGHRTPASVSWEQQYSILNQLTGHSDVFEYACALGQDGWRILSALNTFPGMLNIPETVNIAIGADTLGNSTPVSQSIYNSVVSNLQTDPHIIDLSVFNEYMQTDVIQSSPTTGTGTKLFEAFHIPWGEVTLHTSITGDWIDFPVYPEEYSENITANYSQMPDMLYQYEPWLVYKDTGPRAAKLTFKFHRDMWTGDHRDGKANELIRFCQAQCYPDYRGSAVIAPMVTLFIAGQRFIVGVMTDVDVNWSGPIGLDGFYLACTLSISITQVSQEPLNYQTVRQKPLIG